MSGKLTLIDSDILISILRKEPTPYENARFYLSLHGKINISCLTWYECHRGYKTLGAVKRLKEFDELMGFTNIYPLDDAVLKRASTIYAYLHQQGKLTGEFDLLIGATAIQYDLTLATNNEKHYSVMVERFGLKLENWINERVWV